MHSSSQTPHVFDDGLNLLFGEHVPEAGHATGALTLQAVLLAVGRARLDEADHVGLGGEVRRRRAAGEVPAEGALRGHGGIAVAPALRVAACTAVRTAGEVEVE